MTIPIIITIISFQISHAALFDDEEARAAIKQLRQEFIEEKALQVQKNTAREEREQQLIVEIEQLKKQFESQLQRQALDATTRNQELISEQQKMIGDFEQLEKKNVDLDASVKQIVSQQNQQKNEIDALIQQIKDSSSRLKEFEIEGRKISATEEEVRLYRFALESFKATEFDGALNALKTFGFLYPLSALYSDSRYWLGNSYYAMGDCPNSLRVHARFIERYPQSEKAPYALLNRATCQQELNDATSEKQTLRTLIEQYPNSEAAVTARSRLQKP